MTESLKGDRAIGDDSDDRLGFGPVAARLARTLVGSGTTDGLVLGIEGVWGSGKSSLLNLTINALTRLPQAERPAVVEFRPWLIGDRDGLLRALFEEIAAQIARIEHAGGDATGITKMRTRNVAEQVRSFAARLQGVGKLTSAAGVAVPGLGVVGGFIEKIADAASAAKAAGKSLAATKDQLAKSLARLGVRIVVTIDDVDRLEPAEVLELLRLVRSVADFPNVVYVLCYDPSVLAAGVEQAARVPDGRAFLEKIVQVSVTVPAPEPFDLRRWFRGELAEIAATLGRNERSRLESVIDQEGGQRLTTPRAVVRALNAVRLTWPAVHDDVDPADFVWLQLIRAGNPKFYRWIETYCAGIAVTASWRAKISPHSAKSHMDELNEALQADGLSFDDVKWELSEYLPGLRLEINDTAETPPIYEKVEEHERAKALAGRRLASSDHYRFYFALTAPSNAVAASDMAIILSPETSVSQLSERLLDWSSQKQASGAPKAEVILNRLRSVEPELLAASAEVMIRTFAEILDAATIRTGYDEWFGAPLWRPAERLLPVLLGQLGDRRSKILYSAFEAGAAVGWLSTVLRTETWAHGRHGDRPKPEQEHICTAEELDRIAEIMITRYRAMSRPDFEALPDISNALVAWSQSGDEQRARLFVEREASSDEGLVAILERMSGRVRTAEGVHMTLSASNLSPFFDFEKVCSRLVKIRDEARDSKLGSRAAAVLQMVETARMF